jgi:hypothetical protein
MMLRCLACGARISDTGLTKFVSRENPLISAEQIERAIDDSDEQVTCFTCNLPYNVLVPEEEWETRRQELAEAVYDHHLQLAKAYDTNAIEVGEVNLSQWFADRAEEYREIARENKNAVYGD